MKSFFIILLFCEVINAQITITRNDVELCNTVGITSTSYFDSTTTAADIGKTGESSWDFSSLTEAWSYLTTCVQPSSSPYSSSFPGSAICRTYTTSIIGFQSDHWIFNHLDDNGFYLDGIVSAMEIMGFTSSTTTTYNPSEKQINLPLTYGTTWTQDYSYSTVSSTGGPVATTDVHSTYTVDAYGAITFPGGTTFPALRIKWDEISITGQTYNHSTAYLFFTKPGHSLSISAADTLQPDSGLINIHGAGWVLGNITDVDNFFSSSPSDFELDQNYPNPFNPVTNFRFTILSAESGLVFVSLKIFDVLGNEVAVLVNEEKPAGTYEITFDAGNFSSGVYFYKLAAGNFSETKKMILLR